jgi:hypothetical protein
MNANGRAMEQVRKLWQPLTGRIAWGVGRGHGSTFHMEFGTPHLIVREPVTPKHATTARAQRLLQRRSVNVQGDWTFWIMYGDWRLRTRDGELDSTISPGSPADEALRDLEGQKLLSIGTGAKPSSSVLTFDLGAVLDIWPSAEMQDAQWSLHAWNGRVVSFKHDGSLAFEDAKPRGD